MNRCKCATPKNIIIALIAVVAILLVIIGEKPRHTKPTPPAPKSKAIPRQSSESTTIENQIEKADDTGKDATDSNLNTNGLKRDEMKLSPPANTTSTDKDLPENQSPEPWLKKVATTGQPDKINPAIKKAIDLQSKNPGRYNSQTVIASGEIFGIDTTSGEIWLLQKGAEKWQSLGHPAGTPSGPAGLYFLAGTDSNQATIMNTANAITWRVTLVDGKPQWKEISGPQSDQSWK